MKRCLFIILCLCFMLGLCSCARKGGDVSNVKTKYVASEVYSQEDIQSAIDTVKKDFELEFNGCTLTEIYYAGDEISEGFIDWADRNNEEEVLVLLSSFDTASSAEDGFNSNSTYDNWNWILVRSDGGQWKHVDHGY